jgi:hypothetical protein
VVKSVKRWAVEVKFPGNEPPFLAGKYCWSGAKLEDIPTPTWRTRREAKEAIRHMTSYRKYAKPKCVIVQFKPRERFANDRFSCHG